MLGLLGIKFSQEPILVINLAKTIYFDLGKDLFLGVLFLHRLSIHGLYLHRLCLHGLSV